MRGVVHLIRLLAHLGTALSRGEPWAYWVLGIAAAIAATWGFIAFARRPLGGKITDDSAPDEGTLRDDRNPYRQDF